MSEPPEPVAGQTPAGRVLQLRNAGCPEAAFDFAREFLETSEFEIGVLIEFGEVALALGKPHLTLPHFIRNFGATAGNSWAMSTYQRVLEMSARIIASLARDSGETLIEMASHERDPDRGPLQRHFHSCLTYGLPIDPRLQRQFRELRPDDLRGMAMEPARFTRQPEAAKAAIPRSPADDKWMTAPAAQLWFEEPRVAWRPWIGEPRSLNDGSPKFWEVRNALVYMLPGVFGLVQLADGSFYDPANIGAINLRDAECLRGFGDRRYLFLNGVPPEHRAEKRLPGLSAVPFRLAGTYYFHFLTETLKHAFHVNNDFHDARILLPGAVDYFVRMSRGVLDEAISCVVGAERTMPLDQGIYRADRLLIPREWDYGALDFVDGIVSRLTPDPAGRAGSGSVLFVRRPRAQGRSIVNEAELIEGLAGRYAGFTAVSLDDMSFTQQVSAFANARAVICPHGGGLSNIMFCAPGTIVVEFFFERSGVMYRDVSATRGLRYIGYIHARDGASQSGDETYKIDLVQLRRLLDSLLADAPAAA